MAQIVSKSSHFVPLVRRSLPRITLARAGGDRYFGRVYCDAIPKR